MSQALVLKFEIASILVEAQLQKAQISLVRFFRAESVNPGPCLLWHTVGAIPQESTHINAKHICCSCAILIFHNKKRVDILLCWETASWNEWTKSRDVDVESFECSVRMEHHHTISDVALFIGDLM